MKKVFRKLFRRASKCVFAINVFGSHRHSVVIGQIPPSSFVCAPSSFFVFACNAACVVLASIGFLQVNSIASCAFICARSNVFVFSRNNASIFKYQIPQLKDKRTVTCFSDLKNLQRSARNLLIQTRKLEAHKTS